jgi:hypothetical protein
VEEKNEIRSCVNIRVKDLLGEERKNILNKRIFFHGDEGSERSEWYLT